MKINSLHLVQPFENWAVKDDKWLAGVVAQDDAKIAGTDAGFHCHSNIHCKAELDGDGQLCLVSYLSIQHVIRSVLLSVLDQKAAR